MLTPQQDKNINPNGLTLLGRSVLNVKEMTAFLRTINQGQYAAEWVLNHYYRLEQWYGLRADLLICQMIHEADWLRSWWSQPPRCNMAGIGVTGASAKVKLITRGWTRKENLWLEGWTFNGYKDGIEAHVAHMWAYVGASYTNTVLDQYAAKADPRFLLARSVVKGNRWKIVRLTDLNDRWAVTKDRYGNIVPNQYGQKIEALYHQACAYTRGATGAA